MYLHDYQLYAELFLHKRLIACKSLSFPIQYDTASTDQIYLKYHGFRFATILLDIEWSNQLSLSFIEIPAGPDKVKVSHCVTLQNPVNTADLRFSIIPQLISIFDNYPIEFGELILPKLKLVSKSLRA